MLDIKSHKKEHNVFSCCINNATFGIAVKYFHGREKYTMNFQIKIATCKKEPHIYYCQKAISCLLLIVF